MSGGRRGTRRSRAAASGAALLSLAAGCAHLAPLGAAPRPGAGEVRGFLYADDRGLTVASASARLDEPLGRHVDVHVGAGFDHVRLAPRGPEPEDDAPDHPELTGHDPSDHDHGDVDAVTHASVPVRATDAGLDEWRVEGQVGVDVHGAVRGEPAQVGLRVRGSTEPDYRSLSGTVRAVADLARRNATLSAFAGFGRDAIDPEVAPAGQEELWPGAQLRGYGGVTVAQVVHRRALLSGGATFALQRGTLASPYRSARVRTTLFPEVVPDARGRVVGFVQLATHLGGGTALHLRQGVYGDTWAVWALIPEVALSKELPRGALVSLRYRLYRQGPASFYAVEYEAIEDWMTGDPRLGALLDHTAGVSLRGRLWQAPAGFGSATLSGGYDVSFLEFLLVDGSRVVSHVVHLGVLGTW